jgi:shikimate kinase/3-dehydroquinate synthase
MTAPTQIVLAGLSGAGKSSIGRLIADRLNWRFVDTDEVVLEREGATPADLIVSRGERAFRETEEAVVAEVAAGDHLVVATGGGALLIGRNRAALGAKGLLCYLDATSGEIARRLRASDDGVVRPLLGEDIEARLRELDDERRPYYNHADVWMPVQGATGVEVEDNAAAADRIIRVWSREGASLLARPQRLERLSGTAPARAPAAIVDTDGERYPIWVGRGELSRLPDRLRMLGLDGRRAFVISDSHVWDRHGSTVAEALDAGGIPGASYLVPAGESSKSQRVASELYRWLAEERAERRDVILALGGGVVGDLGGFVAATYLRGMPFVQLPTSVLAMNDASIGGKTAVDLPSGKNLVGAFYQPRAVIADIDTLATLPRRSYTEGFAEVIKHALILDPALLATLEAEAAGLASASPDWDLLTNVTARSMRLKALIVSTDPREQGLRAILNYGHTIGHGLEAATGYSEFLHGEAVAIGMIGAARIGQRLGLIQPELVDRHGDILRSFGLPTSASRIDPGAVINAMRMDKKVEHGRQRFVVLEAIGRAVVRDDVTQADTETVVRSLIDG